MAKFKITSRPAVLDQKRVYRANPIYQEIIDTLNGMKNDQYIGIPKDDLDRRKEKCNPLTIKVTLQGRINKDKELPYQVKAYYDKSEEILHVWREAKKKK